MEFAKALRRLRTRARLTRYRLAMEANVDPGHVGRLERGERHRPGRDLVLRLGQALLDNRGDITLQDIDELPKAAGPGPRPQPVSGSAVLVRGQIRMFPANFAATASAAIDPHPVLGYLGSRHGGQLGNIGQVYPFLSQLPTTPGAALQGHWYVHWRLGGFFWAWGPAEG